MKTLMVTEKPSVAADIATALGSFQKQKGYYESQSMMITWSLGHLVQLAAPEKYYPSWKTWKVDTLPLIPETFLLEMLPSGRSQFQVVSKLLGRKDFDYVINACDAGREGELIFRYLYQMSQSTLPMKRLWISSMTPAEIRKQMNDVLKQNLNDEKYDRLFWAARCRSESDWLVGMNASRALTLGQRRQGNRQVYSIGRVQTPTLSLLVQREEEILQFTARPFWMVHAEFQSQAGVYEGTWFSEEEDRFWEKESAEQLAKHVKGQTGQVQRYKHQEKKEAPPQFPDLTSLQREMNRRAGYSASKTLQIAQTLYERHKLITYPRTDSRYVTHELVPSFSARLQAIVTEETKEWIQPILPSPPRLSGKFINSAKVRDHHAIIPTEQKYLPQRLNAEENLVLSVIHRQFIGAFLPDAIWDEREAITVVGKEHFRSQSRSLIQPGWRALWKTEQKQSEGRNLPVLGLNTLVQVLETHTTEGVTQAPSRHTEGTLLGEMERAGRKVEEEAFAEAMKDHGLGTPATRAAILERLKEMEYVTLQGKQLVPTEKGMSLVRQLPVPELLSAEMTGEWEYRLLQIQNGQETHEHFMEDMKQWMPRLVRDCYATPFMNVENVSSEPKEEWSLLPCPLCKAPLSENSRAIRCSRWNQDPVCTFTLWKTIAGKKLTVSQLKKLILKGQTGTISGFRSKEKKPFSANVILNQGKTEFRFDAKPRVKKKKETLVKKDN